MWGQFIPFLIQEQELNQTQFHKLQEKLPNLEIITKTECVKRMKRKTQHPNSHIHHQNPTTTIEKWNKLEHNNT